MDGLIISGARELTQRDCSRACARRLGVPRARHRRGQRRRPGAAQRLRVLRGGDGGRPARRLRGAGELALQGRRGGLHHPGLRREGGGRARRPAAADRAAEFPPGSASSSCRRRPRSRDAYGIAAGACAVPPDADAWDAWVASQPRLDRAAARRAHQHDLYLGHDGPAQRRAARSRRRPRCRRR